MDMALQQLFYAVETEEWSWKLTPDEILRRNVNVQSWPNVQKYSFEPLEKKSNKHILLILRFSSLICL